MVVLLGASVVAACALVRPEPPGAPPPPGASVEVSEGVHVNVIDEGAGPPVLLIHGCPGSAYDWRPLPERLLAAGFRVIRYDRVGYGYSTRRLRDARHRFDVNAGELMGLLDAMELERTVLVGWSYGGGVAQIAARDAPERVAGLVLIGSAGPLHERGGWDLLEQLLFATAPLNSWAIASGRGRPTIRRMGETAFNDRVPAWWPEQTLALLALPGAAHTWMMEMKHRAPDEIDPDGVRVPTLVLHGTADQMGDFEVAEDLHHRIAQSTLMPVREGSHMLPNTHPDLIADQIGTFTLGLAGYRAR